MFPECPRRLVCRETGVNLETPLSMGGGGTEAPRHSRSFQRCSASAMKQSPIYKLYGVAKPLIRISDGVDNNRMIGSDRAGPG